jgi:S-formylglutathione hydrolase FrmB
MNRKRRRYDLGIHTRRAARTAGVILLATGIHAQPGGAREAIVAPGGAGFEWRSLASQGSVQRAGRVIAATLWSQAMGITKQFVVYLPPSYDGSGERRYPVAYYLHGLWGDEWNWVRHGSIDRTLDSLIAGGMPEMIVVMPDGDDGWYTTWNALGNNAECRRGQPPQRRNESVDAFCVPWPKYDDYIARDLVAYVDSSYRTIADRSGRGIAGLSMGGFGAVTLALGYPDVFSAAASHSGVLSPRYMGPRPYASPARYATSEAELRALARGLWPSLVLAFGRDTIGWAARDPGRLAASFARRHNEPMPALMMDAGRDDSLVDQTRDFHATLDRLGIRHEYAEWPGAHDWSYWRTHVSESLRWLAKQLGRAAAGSAR